MRGVGAAPNQIVSVTSLPLTGNLGRFAALAGAGTTDQDSWDLGRWLESCKGRSQNGPYIQQFIQIRKLRKTIGSVCSAIDHQDFVPGVHLHGFAAFNDFRAPCREVVSHS